jgi:hypothetical protein
MKRRGTANPQGGGRTHRGWVNGCCVVGEPRRAEDRLAVPQVHRATRLRLLQGRFVSVVHCSTSSF